MAYRWGYNLRAEENEGGINLRASYQREARGCSEIQRAYDGRSFALFSRTGRIMRPWPFHETVIDRACRSGFPVP